jgi:hypothetical protein
MALKAGVTCPSISNEFAVHISSDLQASGSHVDRPLQGTTNALADHETSKP